MRIDFEIEEHIAVLSENERTGRRKELNRVSWGGDPAKLDIREWEADYDRGKKIGTFTKSEARKLRDALNKLDLED